MKERGILYSAPMVRAKLAGTKTQTRRIIKGKGTWSVEKGDITKRLWPGYEDEYGDWQWMKCPYGQPGDRLWGRETWCQAATDEGTFKYNAEGNLDNTCCHYRADGYEVMHIDGGETESGNPRSPWVPSIHMPRWASRILDEIIEIRVERVQDISYDDCLAEGWHPACGVGADFWYEELWDEINGPGSWESNPWVWVIVTKPILPAPSAAGR